MKYRVDVNRLRLGDLVAMEKMQNFEALRNVIARVLVDENGKPYDKDKAMAIADEMTVAEMNDFAKALQEAVKQQFIPPTNGGE